MYCVYKRINTAASVIVIKYLNPLTEANQEDCKISSETIDLAAR